MLSKTGGVISNYLLAVEYTKFGTFRDLKILEYSEPIKLKNHPIYHMLMCSPTRDLAIAPSHVSKDKELHRQRSAFQTVRRIFIVFYSIS